MSDEIKAGDIVMLKSGGPPMTVKWVGKNALEQEGAFCEWFVNDKAPWKMESALFSLASLKVLEA